MPVKVGHFPGLEFSFSFNDEVFQIGFSVCVCVCVCVCVYIYICIYVDDIPILANNINEINILQDTFQKNSVLNFIHKLNKNNKISFLGVLIDTNNNNNLTTSTYKKPSNNNSCTPNLKSECTFRYKKSN